MPDNGPHHFYVVVNVITGTAKIATHFEKRGPVARQLCALNLPPQNLKIHTPSLLCRCLVISLFPRHEIIEHGRGRRHRRRGHSILFSFH